jgi:hypothetical protein
MTYLRTKEWRGAPGQTRLLTVRTERLVYLGEWGTRGTVVRFEFAERRFDFTVEREYNVDLTPACHDVNIGSRSDGRDGSMPGERMV